MAKKDRNLRKAAILFASLDGAGAEALLRHMSAPQVEALREAVGRLGEIDPQEQDAVIEEFFRIGPLMGVKRPAGIDLDGRLPKSLSVAARREPLTDDLKRSSAGTHPFRFLHEAPARSLAPFLEREHPQTIAV